MRREKEDLTEAQESALDILKEPAWDADGTRISENTARVLCRKGLIRWSDSGARYSITEKGESYLIWGAAQ